MTKKLEITDYYELVALHKALHVARFGRELLVPALPGSPYLADIAKRVVKTLAEMEFMRGKPERANDWLVKIDQTGEIWQIAVRNAAVEPDLWESLTHQEKLSLAQIYLSPFTYTPEMLEKFVQQVDVQTKTLD
jgi:hypothetical protein